MSNSQFKILNRNQPDANNLVIVVNKSGQVSTDTEILQNLLSELNNLFELKKNDNLFDLITANDEDLATGISILRETSPTPSISEEVMELEKCNLEQLFDEEGNETMEKSADKIAGIFPHATLRMESFISSSEARKFANDVLREFAYIDSLILNLI
jgi:hypothetical protein